jgi:Protein of unknown function (DUF3592)
VILTAASPVHHFFVVFGAAITGFGLIFLLVGVVIRTTSRGFRGAARAQGTIVAFDPRVPGSIRTSGGRLRFGMPWGFQGDAGMVYMPTVEFTTADGTSVKATSHIGTNPRPGKVGDRVTVFYDPRNPERVRVQSGKATMTCMETAFMLFGGGVAALGILILIAAH